MSRFCFSHFNNFSFKEQVLYSRLLNLVTTKMLNFKGVFFAIVSLFNSKYIQSIRINILNLCMPNKFKYSVRSKSPFCYSMRIEIILFSKIRRSSQKPTEQHEKVPNSIVQLHKNVTVKKSISATSIL